MNHARLRIWKKPFRTAAYAAAFRPAFLHRQAGRHLDEGRAPVPCPAEAHRRPVRHGG
jgi:hypothetical protein